MHATKLLDPQKASIAFMLNFARKNTKVVVLKIAG